MTTYTLPLSFGRATRRKDFDQPGRAWWFSKSELEGLAKVITHFSNGNPAWKITDGIAEDFGDGICIQGGYHNIHLRKKQPYGSQDHRYDIRIGSNIKNINIFEEVQTEVARYIQNTNRSNIKLERSIQHLRLEDI